MKTIKISDVEIEELATLPDHRLRFLLWLPASFDEIENIGLLQGDGSRAKRTKANITIEISEEE